MFLPAKNSFTITLTDLLCTLFNTVVFTQHSSWTNKVLYSQWRKRICLLSWSFLFFLYIPIARNSRTNINWQEPGNLVVMPVEWQKLVTLQWLPYTKCIPNIIINVKALDSILASSSTSSECMVSYVWLCDHVTLWSCSDMWPCDPMPMDCSSSGSSVHGIFF